MPLSLNFALLRMCVEVALVWTLLSSPVNGVGDDNACFITGALERLNKLMCIKYFRTAPYAKQILEKRAAVTVLHRLV